MTEKVSITTPNGTEVDISHLESDSQSYVLRIYEKVTPEFSKTEYGHAAMAIASTVLASASMDESPEKQKAVLRKSALEKIKRHGTGIIPLLRSELKLALTDEDIQSIGL